MPLDNEEETFEVVNSRNEVVGTAHRGECNQKGIPHRAVYCLVFNKDGKLLQQQRSDKKRIGPEQWDLSLAEHLQPKETYIQESTPNLCQIQQSLSVTFLSDAEAAVTLEVGLQAVVRGLQEELGITVDHRRIQGPLMACHKRELNIPGLVHDVEYVECYRLDGWDGVLNIDADEVKAIRWISLEEAYQKLDYNSDQHTAWCKAEMDSLKRQLTESLALNYRQLV